MKFSIVCCSMNRTKNLQLALKTWVQIDEIDEIIILDYGSNPAITNTFNDNRIVMYRYNADYWHLSKAYNIAIQLANGNIIIKLDADYILKNNFLDKNSLEYGAFIHGDADIDENLSGFLMLYKKDFLKINGYNEKIINYGYDDNDIYNRLIAIGLCPKILDHNTIVHIPHTDESRKVYNKNPKLTFQESVTQNIIISNEINWNKSGIMTKYIS